MNYKRIWFTSDWHLSHKNIIKYCNRPFDNIYFMNKTIISNYRNIVDNHDTVFFLGDLTMFSPRYKDKIKKWTDGLPGQKHFIMGNHDKFKPQDYKDLGFLSVQKKFTLQLPNITLHMKHNPNTILESTVPYICGHVHEKWVMKGNVINVGVDVWDFKPVLLEQILALLG